MLILTRRIGEKIIVVDRDSKEIELTIIALRCNKGQMSIGCEALDNKLIYREEICPDYTNKISAKKERSNAVEDESEADYTKDAEYVSNYGDEDDYS